MPSEYRKLVMRCWPCRPMMGRVTTQIWTGTAVFNFNMRISARASSCMIVWFLMPLERSPMIRRVLTCSLHGNHRWVHHDECTQGNKLHLWWLATVNVSDLTPPFHCCRVAFAFSIRDSYVCISLLDVLCFNDRCTKIVLCRYNMHRLVHLQLKLHMSFADAACTAHLLCTCSGQCLSAVH